MSGFDPSTATPVEAAPPSGGFDPSTASLVDNSAPPSASAPPETPDRVVGLGERALIQGIGQVADIPGALLTLADRAGASTHDYIRGLLGLKPDAEPPVTAPSTARFTSAMSDAMGLPTPATPGERIASAAVAGAPSAVLAPEARIAGGVSAMLGGAASQTVAENGGSPTEQTIAGLAAGGLPLAGAGVAAGVRGAVRGGAEGAAAMNQRLADAAANGVSLTAGQASGSRAVQAIEASSGRLWGGGPLKAAAERQGAALGSRVSDIVDSLGQGADLSPTTAGEAINTGVAGAKQSMRTAENDAYNRVTRLIPPGTKINATNTASMLDELAAPTTGAENVSSALISPKITALRNGLQADIQAAGGSGAMPYSALAALRTKIGSSIDWGFSPTDPVTNGALKRVYGALTDDINAGASAISPDAKAAVTDARKLYATNQAQRDVLNTVVDKAGGPEAVFTAAMSGTKQGGTKIGTVMNALDPDNQRVVQATVLDRMGRALPGQQNAAGDAFDPSRFLTSWNNLSSEAKDALFPSGPAGSLRQNLDSLTNTLSTIRGAGVLKNVSGSGDALGHNLGLWALLSEGAHSFIEGPKALVSGAGALVGNNLLARALTNPRTVQWLAQTTRLPPSALPNAVNQLAAMGQNNNDRDAQDLALYMHAVDHMASLPRRLRGSAPPQP